MNIKVDPNNGMTKDDEAQLLQKLFSEKYKSEGDVDAETQKFIEENKSAE